MRITTFVLPKRFYGLILGAYYFGLLPSFVFTRLLTTHLMFGVCAGATFYGISNFPKYTNVQLAYALAELVRLGSRAVTVQDVLKFDSGQPLPPTVQRLVELFLEGKYTPACIPQETISRPLNAATGAAVADTTQPSPATVKSRELLRQSREAKSAGNRYQAKRLAAIAYQRQLLDYLKINADALEKQITEMEKQAGVAPQLELPLDVSPHGAKDSALVS